MSIDDTLTIKRVVVLKRHVCYVSPHGGGCWKCRALARYNRDRVYLVDEHTRTRTKGNYHKGLSHE